MSLHWSRRRIVATGALAAAFAAGRPSLLLAQHLTHAGVLRVLVQRGLQVRLSLIEILFFDADRTESNVGFIKTRIDAQLAFEFRTRLRELLFVEKDQAEIVVGLELTGIEFQSGPKMVRGGGRLP